MSLEGAHVPFSCVNVFATPATCRGHVGSPKKWRGKTGRIPSGDSSSCELYAKFRASIGFQEAARFGLLASVCFLLRSKRDGTQFGVFSYCCGAMQ